MSDIQPTTKAHRSALRSFTIWIGREPELADLTKQNIEGFRLAASKVLKPGTVITYVASLRNLAGIKIHETPCLQHNEIEGKLTLWGMFEKHYRPRRLIGKSKNTTRLYRTTVTKFSSYLGRPAMLEDLTDETVANYLDYLTTANAMHTVVKEYDQLMALWRYASRRKLLETYPDLTRPTAPKPVPDAFTVEEMERLIKAAQNWEGLYFEVPAGLWWEALIRVLYDTGERVGAILQVEQNNLNADWLIVPAVTRKGSRNGKRFKLGERTATLLQDICRQSSRKLIFAWPYAHTSIWAVLGKILEAAGLPNDRRGKSHKVRRTVATYYEQAGGNATKLLGHSSRKVTEAYIDERFVSTPQPCDMIPAMK